MEVCKICGANCDNGELKGGICPECIEEEKQRETRAETVRQMLYGQSCQMEMELA